MMPEHSQASANGQLLRKLVFIALLMFGFGFAMVPFYEKICQVAGLTELARADEIGNTQIDKSRTLTIQFDGNTRNLPWRFEPLQRVVTAHPGELVQVFYRVTNTSGQDIVGQAVPSYGPAFAASHVKKLECFCFARQELKAGEVRDMPVQLVIDSAFPKGADTITLSYTFFEVPGKPRLSSPVKG